MQELRKRVNDKYDSPIYVDAEQFRANFIIDTGKAFSEDNFVEMRLASCLMRNAGPTIRCSAVRTDWDKKDKCPENEPTCTLTQFRNIPTKGVVFGMYY